MDEMKDGQRVRVRIKGTGESGDWYSGVVLKARKQWVQLANYRGRPFIADEGNIEEWRPLEESMDELELQTRVDLLMRLAHDYAEAHARFRYADDDETGATKARQALQDQIRLQLQQVTDPKL